jgi:hypothetical protein
MRAARLQRHERPVSAAGRPERSAALPVSGIGFLLQPILFTLPVGLDLYDGVAHGYAFLSPRAAFSAAFARSIKPSRALSPYYLLLITSSNQYLP